MRSPRLNLPAAVNIYMSELGFTIKFRLLLSLKILRLSATDIIIPYKVGGTNEIYQVYENIIINEYSGIYRYNNSFCLAPSII